MNLFEVAREISRRLISVFLRDESGRRPVYGGTQKFQTDPHWLSTSSSTKLLVRLFDRQIHAPEQYLPAWIGMKTVEGGIYLKIDAPGPLFNHPEQQAEGFILIAESSVSTR
jgi:hypothetical protein